MYLVWLGTALVVLKWLEVEPVGSLSWWWVLAPLAVALAWFEGLEKLFGRDRRRLGAEVQPVGTGRDLHRRVVADLAHQARERVAHAFKTPGRR